MNQVYYTLELYTSPHQHSSFLMTNSMEELMLLKFMVEINLLPYLFNSDKLSIKTKHLDTRLDLHPLWHQMKKRNVYSSHLLLIHHHHHSYYQIHHQLSSLELVRHMSSQMPFIYSFNHLSFHGTTFHRINHIN